MLENRFSTYFATIEQQYGMFKGSLFYGETPSYVDFALLGMWCHIKWYNGDHSKLFEDHLKAKCPKLYGALTVLRNRPALKKFEADRNGEPPAHLGHMWEPLA